VDQLYIVATYFVVLSAADNEIIYIIILSYRDIVIFEFGSYRQECYICGNNCDNMRSNSTYVLDSSFSSSVFGRRRISRYILYCSVIISNL
jgi:hypothetical protein